MSRTVALTLTLLSAVLVLLPVTQPKPGLPATLKADEPAYLLAAESLVRDGDLRCETVDLERLFDAYPYLTPKNLILATNDGWHTLTFGKPFLYAAFAAPFVALWGSNGMVAFNLMMVAAMMWLGTLHLKRYNDDATSALFAVGFILWSTVVPFAFWLHPEVFMMTSVVVCLYFGLDIAARSDAGTGRWPRLVAPLLSGASLAFGSYHKPVLALIGLPVMLALLRLRRWRVATTWLAGAAAAGLLAVSVSYLLAGHLTPYLVDTRAGFHIQDPYSLPVNIEEMRPEQAENLEQRSAGWGWLFRFPKIDTSELGGNLRAFFIGRHTGLAVYQPFAILALLLFALYGRRSLPRWGLLAALAGIALFFILQIPFNWHGGGGFVGNRYFVMAYPAFLFLVTRIAPRMMVVAAWLVAGLTIGPLILAPIGGLVPQPTLQAHARARFLQWFPFELTLTEIPGHHGIAIGDVYFLGRKDQMRPIESELWVQGADTVELWAQTIEQLDAWVFDVRSSAPAQEISIALGDDRQTARLVRGKSARMVFKPSRATKIRREWVASLNDYREVFAYRIDIVSETGELPKWRKERPHTFYLGAVLSFRGDDPSAVPPAP